MINTQLMEGIVVDTNDPLQMGRVKICVPGLDGDDYRIENIPWATHLTPFGGNTREYPAGPEDTKTGLMSYGLFVPPKLKALVVCGFLYGDTNRRIYIGSYWRDQGNRSMPVGRNRSDLGTTPVNDQLDPVEPQNTNLIVQFQGNTAASEAQTRGAYERSTGSDDPKDGSQGYGIDRIEPVDEKGVRQLDPQTYALTTPGRHSLLFQDLPEVGRVRIVSASGHQIILDDANERIYVSTGHGKSWFEMDKDGRIHVYGADSLSMSSGGDFNVSAKGSINMSAGADVNIGAGASLKLAGCAATSISGAGVNLESSASFNILASADLILSGSPIHFNGPGAGSAECPAAPTVVPNHEPWARAPSNGKRGKYWKA